MADLDRILVGDARDRVPGVPAASVHCAVTSIPYWGQRVYQGVEPMVWGAADADCEHEWGAVQPRPGSTSGYGISSGLGHSGKRRDDLADKGMALNSGSGGQWCQRCGAWKGCWGLEPTLSQYVANCVEFFRHVRRVLRDDGVLYLNIGDSYAGSGVNDGRTNAGINKGMNREGLQRRPTTNARTFKPGDLCGVPWAVAFALRDDGWYLRSAIVWAKGLSYCPEYSGSVMPESVSGWRWERCGKRTWDPKIDNPELRRDRQEGRDFGKPTFKPCPGCAKCRGTGGWVLRKGRGRPINAYEFVFMLTKGERYFYDAEGVRESGACPAGTRAAKGGSARSGEPGVNSRPPEYAEYSGTRNPRNVWWLPLPDDPKALLGWTDLHVFGPEPLSLAHYAAFPRELPRQAIRAACPKYSCPECGAGWARVVSRKAAEPGPLCPKQAAATALGADGYGAVSGTRGPGWRERQQANASTLGWLPTCSCQANALDALFREHGDDAPAHALGALPHVPGTVLDPCMGAGTTALAAIEEGRHWLGCEASQEYVDMARKRIQEHEPDALLPVVGDVPAGSTLFAAAREED